MIAVARFRGAGVDAQGLTAALGALGSCAGFRRGSIGSSTDEDGLWCLVTEWDGVGAYRRALSSSRVKLEAVPVLALAVDEPGAFEVLVESGPGGDLRLVGGPDRAPDAGTTGPRAT